MTRYERLIRLINREDIDYLPSQITFAERTRNAQIAHQLGLGSADELDGYLENHIQLPFSRYDMPLFLRNDIGLMRDLSAEGYAGLDEHGKTVYDLWGMGIRIGEEGFYYNYSPFKGDREANERARPFLPKSFDADAAGDDAAGSGAAFQASRPHDRRQPAVAGRGDLEVQVRGHIRGAVRVFRHLGAVQRHARVAGEHDVHGCGARDHPGNVRAHHRV